MYTLSHIHAEIPLHEYICNYRNVEKFIVYCKECNRYNRCWACPPFDFDQEKYISGYEKLYIIGTKIVLNEQVIKENQGNELATKTTYQIIEKVRANLDEKLLELEKIFPKSKAFFGGTCHICPAEKCTRIKGKPCIAPDKVRPSLEAFGFDITKTATELLRLEILWSHNGVLPKYFVLVSGFFTNKEIPNFLSLIEF